MKKTLLHSLAVAVCLTGFAQTAPVSATESAVAPRSFDAVRERLRGEAAASFEAGTVEVVAHRRWHQPRRYHGRYKRKRWCGYHKYYGYRCYYTPWLLKKLRP